MIYVFRILVGENSRVVPDLGSGLSKPLAPVRSVWNLSLRRQTQYSLFTRLWESAVIRLYTGFPRAIKIINSPVDLAENKALKASVSIAWMCTLY